VKAIQQVGYGPPAEVVRLVDVPDLDAPGPGEVVITVEASPIQPTDLLMIEGTYGHLPSLPHVLGVEGVGRVAAVGRGVTHVSEGDRVLVPPFTPAWAERVKTGAPWLRRLPDLDLGQLSMLGMNPLTAHVILTEFAPFGPGDWVLQNGANSSVGRAVIPIAKSRGIKTVNVVRRAELVDELITLGADVVLLDGPDLPGRVAEATGNAEIMLALDCVGDSATQDLLNSIALYGTVVVYSGMSGKPFTASGPRLLFHGQSICGFWIFNWLRNSANLCNLAEVFDELLPLLESGALSTPIAGMFGFDQHLEALDTAAKLGGKAILTPRRRP
jgi:NADPH:quinone reductase-like Zn-dependent oxidoreductase